METAGVGHGMVTGEESGDPIESPGVDNRGLPSMDDDHKMSAHIRCLDSG